MTLLADSAIENVTAALVANNRMLDDTVLIIAGDNGGTDTHTVDASNAVAAQHWRTIGSAAPLAIPLVFI